MATPNPYSALIENARILSQIKAADGEMSQEMEDMLSLSDSRIMESTAKMLELRDLANSQLVASNTRVSQEIELQLTHEKTIALLDKRLAMVVDQVGPVTLNARSVSYKESKATNVTDPSLLPTEYQRTVPAKTEPDKAKILKDLRAGKDIPGAELKINKKLEVK